MLASSKRFIETGDVKKKPSELIATLNDLEKALADWDNVDVPQETPETPQAPPPEKARELLERLKRQLQELSQ